MKENQVKYVNVPFIYLDLTCKAGDITFFGLCTEVNCKGSCGECEHLFIHSSFDHENKHFFKGRSYDSVLPQKSDYLFLACR